MEDEGLSGAKLISDARAIAEGLNLTVWPLDEGFEAPRGDRELTVISEQELV